MNGTVYSARGGVYSVRLDSGETVEATLRGRLKRGDAGASRLVIGDRVEVTQTGDSWTVESIGERESQLVRRGRGGRKPKVLVANLDRVLAIVAVRDPDATTELIDRLLVLVEYSGMHPILGLNKVDLEEDQRSQSLASLYESIGYRVLRLSALTGDGIDELRDLLCSGSSALIGPSGAGKSSLLNALDPDLHLRTGELSRKTGTGRHTTVGSRLVPLQCGGVVADTPGFGDVGLWGVAADDVESCFPEFGAFLQECRFRGCAHLQEPSCGIRRAVDDGLVEESRYLSYVALRSEAEAGAAF